MKNWYFTFGSNKCFPHQNGYIVIVADDIGKAISAFKNKYPDRTEGILNCSDYYSENQWQEILNNGYYNNQTPKEIIYENLAQKRELELFGTLLSMFGISYETQYGQITLTDENGNKYCDSDGVPMRFANTIDALNSIDWMLDMEPKQIQFQDSDFEREEM